MRQIATARRDELTCWAASEAFRPMLWYLPPILLLVFWAVTAWERAHGLARLPQLSQLPAMPDLPTLSVVIPARDEEKRLPECLQSLAGADYPQLEVLIVDDRSQDATGRIADDYARELPDRFQAIHIAALPDGWLGKCNALATGAEQARGEYVLFTDADVVFHPEALRRAAAHAVRVEADLLVGLPHIVLYTFLERVMATAFMSVFLMSFSPWRAMQRKSPVFIGVGAFNMVRASFYRQIGGHRFLRLQVVDDAGLGKIMKYAGGKVRVVAATDMVRVRWQESFAGLIAGLEKNAFAALGYRTVRAILACTLLVLAHWWGFIGIWFGPAGARILCALLIAEQPVVNYVLLRKQSPIPPLFFFTLPVGALFIAWAMLRSMWVTLRQGGVRWRDSFYPLSELRKFRI